MGTVFYQVWWAHSYKKIMMKYCLRTTFTCEVPKKGNKMNWVVYCRQRSACAHNTHSHTSLNKVDAIDNQGLIVFNSMQPR